MENKFSKGNWTYSPMRGTHGHCFAAQVWDSEGHNLATIETKNGEIEATANAKLISAAPEMLEALNETDKDLCVLESNMRQIELKDHLAVGMTELIQKWRERNKQAIKKAIG